MCVLKITNRILQAVKDGNVELRWGGTQGIQRAVVKDFY
jgi:hypothetical protein